MLMCRVYAALDSTNQIPFKKKLFNTNDVTYLTRDLNQTYKVKNISQDLCLAMRCSRYEAGDREHYGNFQTLSNQDLKQTHSYNPKSDMDFEKLFNEICKEWIATYAQEIQL